MNESDRKRDCDGESMNGNDGGDWEVSGRGCGAGGVWAGGKATTEEQDSNKKEKKGHE